MDYWMSKILHALTENEERAVSYLAKKVCKDEEMNVDSEAEEQTTHQEPMEIIPTPPPTPTYVPILPVDWFPRGGSPWKGVDDVEVKVEDTGDK